jgi:hypothetical protein
VPELPPQDAQRRFQLVCRRFINVFARPEHPLALFLDDLQWLDAATLDLLEDLLTQPDVRHLMLIGAYRDNEVDSTHPLLRKLEAIRQAGAAVQEIVLAPLAREDLEQLIGDSLRCEPERAASLARLLHEKTAGNPFFAISSCPRLLKRGYSTSIIAKCDGLGTSNGFTPRVTPITWWTSWSGSSAACRSKPRKRCSSLPALATARTSDYSRWFMKIQKMKCTVTCGKQLELGSFSVRKVPIDFCMTGSRRQRTP